MAQNFNQPPAISRRTMLRGLGVGMALPLLGAMESRTALLAATGSAAKKAMPVRAAFLYVPNGMKMDEWLPTEAGELKELPPLLQNLSAFKSQMTVISNLAQHRARANGDGPGDHARSMATFMTGMQAKKTSGADIRIGVSVDQAAAQQIGSATRFASLELGIERSRQSGECDSGYACAYSSNMSWKSESTPCPAEVNPRLVFERLFGGGEKSAAAESKELRDKYQKSILDFALEDAKQLNSKLGKTDQRKLDEYLTSVRELEQRITRSESEDKREMPKYAKPEGIPKKYSEHLQLMLDMLVLAFQTDSTRIATLPFANEGSNKSYTEADVNDGHHELSHHGNDKAKLEKIARINALHIQNLGYFLDKLKNIKEQDRSLLDNCMIAYGSCIGDGNRHNHDKLPIAVFGRGGYALKPGRHIKLEKETPLNNLWLTMTDVLGAKLDSVGDSTGRVKEILAHPA